MKRMFFVQHILHLRGMVDEGQGCDTAPTASSHFPAGRETQSEQMTGSHSIIISIVDVP